ncbi:RGCVC family protein [Saccharothrix sp. 6-C]|nr:RGCVC family protein [Saccharothrix sp. 6-C]
MPTIESTDATGTTAAENPRCAACPHPWATHDRIAMRFCTATTSGGHHRGCVCGS